MSFQDHRKYSGEDEQCLARRPPPIRLYCVASLMQDQGLEPRKREDDDSSDAICACETGPPEIRFWSSF